HAAHPGASAFVFAFKELAAKKAERCAILFKNLIHANILMINRPLFSSFESHSKKLGGREGYSIFEYIVQLEVRLNQVLIQIIPLQPDFFSVIAPIVRLQVFSFARRN